MEDNSRPMIELAHIVCRYVVRTRSIIYNKRLTYIQRVKPSKYILLCGLDQPIHMYLINVAIKILGKYYARKLAFITNLILKSF